MNKLAPTIIFTTLAGAVRVPDWLEPYFACDASDKKSLFAHMEKIGLPATAWNEWRKDIAVERVGDIRSFYDLFTIWLRVLTWQKSCRVVMEPIDEWGAMIARQIRLNQVDLALTPRRADVLFPSLTSTSALFEAASIASIS